MVLHLRIIGTIAKVGSNACKLSIYTLVYEYWNCWNNTLGSSTSVGLPAANPAKQKFSLQISATAVKPTSVSYGKKKRGLHMVEIWSKKLVEFGIMQEDM